MSVVLWSPMRAHRHRSVPTSSARALAYALAYAVSATATEGPTVHAMTARIGEHHVSPVVAADSLTGNIVGGAIGGLVSAAVVAAVAWACAWWRRPVIKPSVNAMPVNWRSGGMAVIWLNVMNAGRSPAREVELEVTVPGALLPRVEGREPVRFDREGKEYVFVASLSAPLHQGSEQTALKVVLNHNIGEPLLSGVFDLPVVARAANAREVRETVRFTLPAPEE
jgi:hypothetical protein